MDSAKPLRHVSISLSAIWCHVGRMPDVPASEMPARRGWVMPAMGWSLGVLMIYMLSPGPVLAFWDDPPVEISAFYKPLETVYRSVPVVHDFYTWYFNLWGI
jgi:hypothetical protein